MLETGKMNSSPTVARLFTNPTSRGRSWQALGLGRPLQAPSLVFKLFRARTARPCELRIRPWRSSEEAEELKGEVSGWKSSSRRVCRCDHIRPQGRQGGLSWGMEESICSDFRRLVGSFPGAEGIRVFGLGFWF